MLGRRSADDLVISSAAGEGAIPARIVAVTPMHEKAVLLLRFADGTEWLAALRRTRRWPAPTTACSSVLRRRRRCCSIAQPGFASPCRHRRQAA